jgi:hypothetical protein
MPPEAFGGMGRTEALAQAALVRDVFGNPHRPVAVFPAWRTADVLATALAASDERDEASGSSFCPVGCLSALGLLARSHDPPPRSPIKVQPLARRLGWSSLSSALRFLRLYFIFLRQPRVVAE